MAPAWLPVFSLYSLQKPMMLTPCWPNAGPTGGAGLALPASIWSLMIARTFFAMLEPLHLEEVQLHRRLPAEEGDQHLHLALLQVQVVDDADEVLERAVDDAHALADAEADFDARLLDAHLAQDALHLFPLQRHRPVARADEAGDARRVPHHEPGAVRVRVILLELHHLHQDVAGEDLL